MPEAKRIDLATSFDDYTPKPGYFSLLYCENEDGSVYFQRVKEVDGEITNDGDPVLISEANIPETGVDEPEYVCDSPATSGCEFYKCASVDTTTKTWTGYKAVLTDGVYSFEETVTGGLSYGTAFTPSSGVTYNADATVYVSELWRGIPSLGLVFHASFDSDSDVAETGQDIINEGDVVYTTKDGVPCASFNGANYMTFSDSGMPEGTSARTLSCWFYCDSLETYTNPIILGYGTRATSQFCGLFIQPDLSICFAGYSAPNNLSTDANAVSVGRWHHVLATKNGDRESIYVDGVLAKSGTSGKNTVLGVGQIADTTDSDVYRFDGQLAGCRIYNRELSNEEIVYLSREFMPVYG